MITYNKYGKLFQFNHNKHYPQKIITEFKRNLYPFNNFIRKCKIQALLTKQRIFIVLSYTCISLDILKSCSVSYFSIFYILKN